MPIKFSFSIIGCKDILVEYSLDGVNRLQFSEGGHGFTQGDTVHFRVADDNLRDGCCFNFRGGDYNNPINDNREIMITMPSVKWYELLLYTGDCCTPRYKDIDTLVARTNCMCSKLGVETITIGQRTAFAIIDRCIEEDINNNPFNLGFHIVTIVMDPNYLMQTMECLCDNRNSNPEYIVTNT